MEEAAERTVSEEASEILGRMPKHAARGLLYLIALCVVGAGLYVTFGKVDIVVHGTALLVPQGHVQRILAPMEGEVVEDPRAVDGTRVRKGEVLLLLKSPEAVGREAERHRLEEEVRESKAAIDRFQAKKASAEEKKKLLRDRTGLLRDLEASNREMLEKRLPEEEKIAIERRRTEIEKTRRLLEDTRADLELKDHAYQRASKEHEGNRKLYEAKNISEKEYNESQNRVDAARGLVIRAQGEVSRLERDIAVLEGEVRQTELAYQQKRTDLSKEILQNAAAIMLIEAELLQIDVDLRSEEEGLQRRYREAGRLLEEAQTRVESRFVSYEIVPGGKIAILAPADGIVTDLGVKRRGDRVVAGQPVMTIAPLEAPVVAEMRVANRDIGGLRVGQEVRLKYEAFPFQQYGVKRGRVQAISSDAVFDQLLGPVFTVTVELLDKTVSVGGEERPLRFGLRAAGEVVTGRRTLLRILVDPLHELAERRKSVSQ